MEEFEITDPSQSFTDLENLQEAIERWTEKPVLGEGINESDFLTPNYLVIMKQRHAVRELGYQAVSPLLNRTEFTQSLKPNRFEISAIARSPMITGENEVTHWVTSASIGRFSPKVMLRYGTIKFKLDEFGDTSQHVHWSTTEIGDDIRPFAEIFMAAAEVQSHLKLNPEDASRSDFRTCRDKARDRMVTLALQDMVDGKVGEDAEGWRFIGTNISLRDFFEAESRARFIHLVYRDRERQKVDEVLSKATKNGDHKLWHFKEVDDLGRLPDMPHSVLVKRVNRMHLHRVLSGDDVPEAGRIYDIIATINSIP